MGIKDARTRLLLRDPEKRAEYVEELYRHQMELLHHSQDQDKELIDLQMETIRTYRDKALDETADIEDLKKLLSLVGSTVSAPTGVHPLSDVKPEDEEAKTSHLLETDAIEGESVADTDEKPPEQEESPQDSEEKDADKEPEKKPARRRRRPRSRSTSKAKSAEPSEEETSSDSSEESNS